MLWFAPFLPALLNVSFIEQLFVERLLLGTVTGQLLHVAPQQCCETWHVGSISILLLGNQSLDCGSDLSKAPCLQHTCAPLHSSLALPGTTISQVGAPPGWEASGWREDGASQPNPSAQCHPPEIIKPFPVHITEGLLCAKHYTRNNEHCEQELAILSGEDLSVHVLILILIVFQKCEASMQKRYISNQDKDGIGGHKSFSCKFVT